MLVRFQKKADFQRYRESRLPANARLGFIPTMGALHHGHLALIKRALNECDFVACSIFVNPTQFNQAQDLEQYPRTEEKDLQALLEVGCHLLFLPTIEQIYPEGPQNADNPFSFGHLERVMEGAHRPGHFAGVAQVVSRLLQIVQPHALYMGQKDYQQTLIVRSMLQQMQSSTRLIVCPTVREKDGLALSSRNLLLSPKHRQLAPKIYQYLQAAAQAFRQEPSAFRQIEQHYMQKIQSLPGFRPEYFSFAQASDLKLLREIPHHPITPQNMVLCTAVWAGNVRLIDNLLIE